MYIHHSNFVLIFVPKPSRCLRKGSTAFDNVKKVAVYNKEWDIANRKLPL